MKAQPKRKPKSEESNKTKKPSQKHKERELRKIEKMGPDVSAPVSHGIQSERRVDKQRSLSRSQARIIGFIGRRDDFRFSKALKGGTVIKGVGDQVR